jgi:hypothetical protein
MSWRARDARPANRCGRASTGVRSPSSTSGASAWPTRSHASPFEDLERTLDLAHLGSTGERRDDLHEWLLRPSSSRRRRGSRSCRRRTDGRSLRAVRDGGEPGGSTPTCRRAPAHARVPTRDTHAIAYYGSLRDLARPAVAQRTGETAFLVARPGRVRGAEKETRAIVLALGDRPVRVMERARRRTSSRKPRDRDAALRRPRPRGPARRPTATCCSDARGSDCEPRASKPEGRIPRARTARLVVHSGCHNRRRSCYAARGSRA